MNGDQLTHATLSPVPLLTLVAAFASFLDSSEPSEPFEPSAFAACTSVALDP